MKKLTLYLSILVFLPLYPTAQAQDSSVDFAVTISGPETVKPGASATYTITISNRGSSRSSVHTLDVFASELTFLSSASDSRCSVASDFSPPRIGCSFGFIGIGESATAKITFKVSDASACNSSFAQGATAFTTETDGNNSDNHDRITTSIVCGNSNPISISSITFSSDYDTVTATLSRIPSSDEDLRFNYAFYKEGIVVSGGTSPLSQSKNVTMTGFQRHMENSGINERYDVDFAVCPNGHDIPSPLCGPAHRMSFTDDQDDQINEAPKPEIVCGFVPEGESVLQCEKMISTSCQRLRGTGYPNVETCRSKVSKGYCCAPENPDFAQCQNLVSQAVCDGMGGTLSEFRNAGSCTNCRVAPSTSGEPYLDISNISFTQKYRDNSNVIRFEVCNKGTAPYHEREYGSIGTRITINNKSDNFAFAKNNDLPAGRCEEAVIPNITSSFFNFGDLPTGYYNMQIVIQNEPANQNIIQKQIFITSPLQPLPQSWQDRNDIIAPPAAGYEDEVLTNPVDYSNPFPDTSISDLAGKAAAELYRRAVIGGYPDGEFKGYRDVNRAEAAKFLLLARYGNISEVRNSGKFPDVPDGQWYTKYVVTAADKGIISGHPDGTFRPADAVNTAEFLKMLSLTFGLQLNLQHSYADVSSQEWFTPYAGIADKYDVFPRRTRYLLPGDPLTREEVAVAIYQYLQNR